MTFWDFWAPFYDVNENLNKRAYAVMLKTVRDFACSPEGAPQNARILEVAAGTGSISLAVCDKVSAVLCTDISDKMLSIAKKKAAKKNAGNITFANLGIFETGLPDNSYDTVIAGQVLHLIDHPELAAAELKRVTNGAVIMPISFTKTLRGLPKLQLFFFRLIGFAPKVELEPDEYDAFLSRIGFENCEIIQIPGRVPMAVAVWFRTRAIQNPNRGNADEK
jgi:ubiquinone/menaquinone biosynthesis C-methylase UbiE